MKHINCIMVLGCSWLKKEEKKERKKERKVNNSEFWSTTLLIVAILQTGAGSISCYIYF